MNHTMKALLLVVPMLTAASVSAADCSKWMTEEFWKDATGEAAVKAVRGCLAQSADPNAQNWDGQTPLHWAAVASRDAYNAAAVSALLKAGANPNAQDKDGITPLHVAVLLGHVDAVLALLKAGANPNAKDNDGNTPLHTAAFVNAVLAGADLNTRTANGETPLHAAARDGHAAMVFGPLKYFGKAFGKAIVEALGEAIVEALVEALDKIIPALLDAGADGSIETSNGKTPFDYAKEKGTLKGTETYRRLKDAQDR